MPASPPTLGIGVLNGVLGGMTGLAGPVITIWCQCAAGRRTCSARVFQPVILAAFALTAISLTVAGTVTAELVKIYLYGLPPLAAGLWSD